MLVAPTLERLQKRLPRSKFGSLYGADVETRGTDPKHPDSCVIGIGLADKDGCLYVDLRDLSEECHEYLKEFLRNVKLVAFNTKFDAAFLALYTGQWLNWVGCAYRLFKAATCEGYPGQRWNLETMQLHYLGYPYTNKADMEYLLQINGLTKATMWRLGASDLGPYCAVDADSAYWGWVCMVEDLTPRHQLLLDFEMRDGLNLIRLLVRNMFHGMMTDVEHLTAYRADLLRRVSTALDAFRTHPQVAHHIRAVDASAIERWERSAPPHLTKKGEVNKNWLKWRDRREKVLDEEGFNCNSKQQLARLFYEQVFEVVRENAKLCVINVEGKNYEVEKTKKGARSVKKQILPLFGEPGAKLMDYNKLVKEEGYVRAALALTKDRGVLYPEFNSYATISGRLSGGADDGVR